MNWKLWAELHGEDAHSDDAPADTMDPATGGCPLAPRESEYLEHVAECEQCQDVRDGMCDEGEYLLERMGRVP